MDLRLSPEQRDFRAGLRELLSQPAVRAEARQARLLPAGQEPGLLEVYRQLGKRGWLAVNWPVEYGGLGGTLADKAILTEELIAYGIPDVVHTLSIDIVGLALHEYGTVAQKRRWLPRLAGGDGIGCVLFSEPDTGSDLAALTTRAERDGSGWRLRGRKVYGLKSWLADFGLCAARTSDSPVRYHGLTVFVLPMDTPGVVAEPLWTMAEEHFGDITLDGPLMTPADVLGEVDDGWRVINGLLRLERTGIEWEAKARRMVDTMLAVQPADAADRTDPAYAARLVELDAEVKASRLLAWRAVNSLTEALPDQARYAMAKWHTSETARSAAQLSAEVCGLGATLSARDPDAPAGGLLEADYRDAPGYTLASGTSEVMLSLIASALGLPT
jgi:alkylation response protein AidB-like acyl-CoA dehydrogenase